MTPSEAAALLTVAAAFDNRKPDADTARAWAIALDDLRFEDCRAAIVAHYRSTREWLMPIDVINGVRRIRDQRLADHGPLNPPADLDPDDTDAWTAWLRSAMTAVADGHPPVAGTAAAVAVREVDYADVMPRP